MNKYKQGNKKQNKTKQRRQKQNKKVTNDNSNKRANH